MNRTPPRLLRNPGEYCLAAMVLALTWLLAPDAAAAPGEPTILVENGRCALEHTPNAPDRLTYRVKGLGTGQEFELPSFEIDGRMTRVRVQTLVPIGVARHLRNGASEYAFEGTDSTLADLRLRLTVQIAPDNPIIRLSYALAAGPERRLTRATGHDQLRLLALQTREPQLTEIRISEFNERMHATHRTQVEYGPRHFEDGQSLMGPLIAFGAPGAMFVVGYEHGSQYPNRFLEYRLGPDRHVALAAVKGAYLAGDPADGFQTVWLQIGGVAGDETALADAYRDFELRYATENLESRKPYIFYNTWGRQERVKWSGRKYLTTMNLDYTLREIDRAHAMGIEVFVLDTGWYGKTGDWQVNTRAFPDGLQQVRARLEKYHMKLGLWFNPTVAAVSSQMLARNRANRMSEKGAYPDASPVWETEASVGMCLVSPYWQDFADKLIELHRTLGVTYFKWDGIAQYGCDDPHHYHGGANQSEAERADRYAFLLPLYMTKIIDRVTRAVPDAIVDFDVTEPGRCVGLQFLSSGKYFIINNGPYYHSFDLAPPWKSPLPNGNANIFVQPGPARGWFVRGVLDYDRWIPSVLFLSHYQPDEPKNSQWINVASLILGQNGIWGEILKTSDEGVALFADVLGRYKRVRDDITAAPPIRTGEPGGSPEIYEKINPATGRGCVVMFANAAGRYQYVTERRTHGPVWHNAGVTVKADASGRAMIDADFDFPSARIVFFGD